MTGNFLRRKLAKEEGGIFPTSVNSCPSSCTQCFVILTVVQLDTTVYEANNILSVAP